MRSLIKNLIVFALVLHGIPVYAESAKYVVDPARSELVVRLFKGGIASALAHNHVIRATKYSGEADINRENPPSTTLWIEAQADSLRADEPALREKYGLTKPMTEEDRQKIESTMKSQEQMDIKTYPTIRFESTNIENVSSGQYLVTGQLTIHGVARTITFQSSVSEADGGINGRASIPFKQSDFGITPYSAFFGAIRNEDGAVLDLDIFLIPPPGPMELR